MAAAKDANRGVSAKDEETNLGDDGVGVRTPKAPWYRQLWAIRDTLIVVLTPIIFLPIFFASTSKATRCAYSVLIIAVYWMTECLPMSVTALLPVVLMPWLGVMDSKDICKNYLKDTNFLFLGGLLISVAVEKWGLHKRVGLRVLMLVGSKPVWITFGFMAVTGFLSMWLPNIPTTAMMIPIAAAVLEELDSHRKHVRELRQGRAHDKGDLELRQMNGKAVPRIDSIDNGDTKQASGDVHEKVPLKSIADAEMEKIYAKEDKEFRNFACALKLSVTYASNVGGLGTIIGCGPNIVFKGQLEAIYGPNTGINFFSFFIFAFPLMLILLPISWFTLMVILVGPKKAFCQKANEDGDGETSAAAIIKREYKKLGRMSWTESWITGLFLFLASFWITKNPQFVPGWGNLLSHNFVTDSSVAISVAIFLFIIPSQPPNYLCFRRRSDRRPPGPAPAILDWPTVHKQMQWGVLLLLGGGFAIADACKNKQLCQTSIHQYTVSDLSSVIATFLSIFKSLPAPLIVFIVSVLAVVCTTFTANVACATLVIPIVAELANGVEMNPIYVMFPVTMAVNFAYLLPVSTPSNAIIFAYGGITVSDMLKVGIVNCILHVLVLQLAINTWGYAIFNLGEFPDWARASVAAKSINGTLASVFETSHAADWLTTAATAL